MNTKFANQDSIHGRKNRQFESANTTKVKHHFISIRRSYQNGLNYRDSRFYNGSRTKHKIIYYLIIGAITIHF